MCGWGVAEIHVPIKHKQPNQPIHTSTPIDINSPTPIHTPAPTLKLKSRKLEDRKFETNHRVLHVCTTNITEMHQMKQNVNLIVSEKLQI